MRILYLASGIPVPGTLGGSTHTYEVARNLTRRGHQVHVVAARHGRWGGLPALARPETRWLDGFRLHTVELPRIASLLSLPLILRLARAIRPDIIMERYYNFAGAGMLAARTLGVPSLLEVNALIVDPPGVFKRRLDDALGGPMRRWATQQCRWASRIVTPLHTTIPPEIPRDRVCELPWGADVERFAPRSGLPRANPTALFLGSFRNWHGVTDFVRAVVLLLERGQQIDALLVGDGPERALAERLAAAWPAHFTFTGAVPYEQVPALVASADVGVAPFTTAPHPALRAAGFFWSPLKIFEYMAAGLPVVTADIPPLNTIVRDGQEGLLFREGDLPGLADAITRVLTMPERGRALGLAGRARVVAEYSWARHAEQLEELMHTICMPAL